MIKGNFELINTELYLRLQPEDSGSSIPVVDLILQPRVEEIKGVEDIAQRGSIG